MKYFVSYFLNRPLVVNAVMFGLIGTSVILWKKTPKEEMPSFTSSFFRIYLKYPGASAGDVEFFVTRPVEEALKGLTNLGEVTSTSSHGRSTVGISFHRQIKDLQGKIQDVKEALASVKFPSEVKEPIYRQFKSSEKAIIDIGLYLEGQEILNRESRELLQRYVLAFKNKLLSLQEVSGVNTTGYLKPELHIKVRSDFLEKYEVSMAEVKAQILSQNVRQPVGSIKDQRESKVSIISELNDIQSLQQVSIASGFQGQKLKLGQISEINDSFEEASVIHKVQGREGIIFNVQKSESIDILKAKKAIIQFIEGFKKNDPNLPMGIVLIDDESYDVENRLGLIGSNGLVGFILIVLILFLFLDFRSSIWVAMGIPFSLAFTLIASFTLGYTVNNITLASIIIVLGIVVDDAIIMAENISRRRQEVKKGEGDENAVVTGAVMEVGVPVVASVLTTCAAFVPLYFFSGRFSAFVKYIPVVVSLMLLASLVESFFILPSHLTGGGRRKSVLGKYFKGNRFREIREGLVRRLENGYARLLFQVLRGRHWIILGAVFLLALSGYIFMNHLNYVMFPREESRSFRLKVIADPQVKRYEMAQLVRKVEDIFLNDGRAIVTSVRTSISHNRRGREVKENEASLRVEIVPPSKRDISFVELIKQWKKKTKALHSFREIKFQKNHFASDSGSPLVIEVRENNDDLRFKIANGIREKLEGLGYLNNIELEKPPVKYEYELDIKKDESSRLGVKHSDIALILRTYLQGDILYSIIQGDEEVGVRLIGGEQGKSSLDDFLQLRIPNAQAYLVPIKNLVNVREVQRPSGIRRVNYKRVTKIFADIGETTELTPLEIAGIVEKKIFPEVLRGSPSSLAVFRGEVEDSRESKSDFFLSLLIVFILVYIILIFLFDSLGTPFLVMSIIPFGVMGTILAFFAHGIVHYGFFAVVGVLGMIGVVINDSIVLINRLEVCLNKVFGKAPFDRGFFFRKIAEVSSTRLRAILITTITTVAGLFPTAYGVFGYDSMLAEMMLAMGWGLLLGMFVTLVLVPCLYSYYAYFKFKKSKPLTLSVVFILAFFSGEGQASLSLKSFIDLCEKNDPEYKVISLERQRLRYYVEQSLRTQKTLVSVNAQGNKGRDLTFTGELAQEFSSTGTSLSLSHEKGRKRATGFWVEQSLSKNIFGRDIRLQRDSLRMEKRLKVFEIQERHEVYISDLVNQYISLENLHENYKIAQDARGEALKLVKNLESKKKMNIASSQDVNRGHLLLLLKDEDLLKKKNIYENLKRKMEKQTLSKITFQEGAMDKLIIVLSREKKSIFEISLKNLHFFLVYALKEKIAQKKVILQARTKGVDLKLIAGYQVSSLNQDGAIVGLNLDIPLFANDSDYQVARINSQRATAELRKKEMILKDKVEAQEILFKEKKAQWETARKKVRLMKSILSHEERRFSLGKIDLGKIIEMKNSYASYHLELQEKKMNYAQALLAWHVLTDSLTQIKDKL